MSSDDVRDVIDTLREMDGALPAATPGGDDK